MSYLLHKDQDHFIKFKSLLHMIRNKLILIHCYSFLKCEKED